MPILVAVVVVAVKMTKIGMKTKECDKMDLIIIKKVRIFASRAVYLLSIQPLMLRTTPFKGEVKRAINFDMN